MAITVVINDPTGDINEGIPTYRWGEAPKDVYATRRQLSALGLRRNKQPVAAQMIRPRQRKPDRPLIAYLYLIELAAPKRPFTEAKRRAVHTAAQSRRVCDYCGPTNYIPRFGVCEDCRATRKVAA